MHRMNYGYSIHMTLTLATPTNREMFKQLHEQAEVVDKSYFLLEAEYIFMSWTTQESN